MSTLTDSGFPTLVDVAKRTDPDGKIATIAELLSEQSDVVADIPFVEGNLPTGHRITDRTALPGVTWRRLNEAVAATKSSTAQFDEVCGMLEAYAKVDVDVAKLNGNTSAFRMSEDKAFLEAMTQEAEESIFYSSVLTAPEQIHGLMPRYSATTGITASDYVFTVGTPADSNAHSVMLINWDPDKIFGIFPKGSQAGLQHKDLGEQLITDSTGHMRALVTHWQWKLGIAVRDYRYAVRMQWDPDDTTNMGDDDKGMYLALMRMLDTIHKLGPGAKFYMNRTSFRKLNAQLASNDANYLTYLNNGGKRIASFQGVPIRIVDSLVAETAIS